MTSENFIQQTVSWLSAARCPLTNEKQTQQKLFDAVKDIGFVREHRLDEKNIPDLFCQYHGIAVEVKIKGSKKDIYRQLLRYSQFAEVKILILCTNKALGLPPLIGGKPVYFIHLGKAYL